MPTALAHLRIALQLSRNSNKWHLLRNSNNFALYHFLVGNIAPDSGQKSSVGVYDPPKTVTHFKVSNRGPFTLGDWIFYQRHLLPHSDDIFPAHRCFLLGYFCHLLTDNLWIAQIGSTLEKSEMTAIDAHFLTIHSDFTLPTPEPLNIPPDIEAFLPKSLILTNIAQTLKSFDHLPEATNPPPDSKRVDHFVNAACECFIHIMSQLQNGIYPPTEAISVLDFFRDFYT